jgi:hypothetical protein
MATKKKQPLVIIRTRDAGVHIGRLVSRDSGEVTLSDARRLWRWKGANTLNEVATKGVDKEYSRLSEPVAKIIVIGACEVIEVSNDAVENLTTSRWPL